MKLSDYLLDLYKNSHLSPVWLIVGGDSSDVASEIFALSLGVLSKSDMNPNALQASMVEKMMTAQTYPNFCQMGLGVDEDGKPNREITIDRTRDLKTFLQMTPAIPGWRVAVINDADCMNRNAANSLLKFLEEPPRQTLILMTCKTLGTMLPTIRSRCQVFSMRDSNASDQNNDWDAIAADFVKAALAGNGPLPALTTKINKDVENLHAFEASLLRVIASRVKTLPQIKHQARLSHVWHNVHTLMLASRSTHLDINHVIQSYTHIIADPSLGDRFSV